MPLPRVGGECDSNRDPVRGPYGIEVTPLYSGNGYMPYGRPTPEMLRAYRTPLRRWANAVGVVLILVRLSMEIVYTVLYLLLERFQSLLSPELWSLLDESVKTGSYLLALWLPTLLLISWIRIPPKVAFPMRGVRASTVVPAVMMALGAAMVGSIASGAVTLLLEAAFGVSPYMPDMPLPTGLAANIVYCVELTVAPAIFEELLFRGVVLQTMRRFGDGFALVVSSALFAMLHGNLVQGISTFCVGMVLGYFALRTGSLAIPMLAHFVNNAVALAATYLLEGMSEQQAILLNMVVLGMYALLGVVGVVLMAARSVLGGLAPSRYPLTAGQKFRTFLANPGQIIFLLITVIITAIFFQ